MTLTEKVVANAKPGTKLYRLFDGNGLYLELLPAGGKYWRMKYQFAGKERRLALGVYPIVTLKAARDRSIDARRLVANGVDPGEQKRLAKAARIAATGDTLEPIALQWLIKQKPLWAASHWDKIRLMLERDIYPWLGKRPIRAILPLELLAVLRRVEGRGALDTTKRVRIVLGQVFRYAVANGLADRDPTPDLKGAIASVPKSHLASITDPAGVGRLMTAIAAYEGTPVVRAALQLAPLTFVRPGAASTPQQLTFPTARKPVRSLRITTTVRYCLERGRTSRSS